MGVAREPDRSPGFTPCTFARWMLAVDCALRPLSSGYGCHDADAPVLLARVCLVSDRLTAVEERVHARVSDRLAQVDLLSSGVTVWSWRVVCRGRRIM